MQYTKGYASPLGGMLLACDDTGLVGLWFEGQRYFARGLTQPRETRATHPILRETARWLDVYFSGREPGFTPPLHPAGTPFRSEVWRILCGIPYGTTTTYGAIAAELARRRGASRVSARAVGGAVGHNPISLIIPCHRVVGADGALTGYAGGLDRKSRLLALEGIIKP